MKKIEFLIPNKFEIKSAQRTYPVEFYPHVESVVESLKKIKNPVFIVDSNIRKLYSTYLDELLSSFPTLEINAIEDSKTFEGIGNVIYWLSDNKITKANHVVAIGGGIIQDIVTFSTCIFFRGVPWSLVPTTLLSMSDSCIGAKCGINLKNLKNQLGVFNSPYAVYITADFLHTLDYKDVKSGYGEILKLYLTDSFEKFTELENEINREGSLISPLTSKHVAESLLIKKKIIEEDEYEAYLRMVLNYGHTFGHALETVTDHFVPHGLAVAWGLDFDNFLSVQNGWLDQNKAKRIQSFIKKHLSFKNTKSISSDAILNASRRDKKMTSATEMNMIYFTNKNQLEIKKTPIDEKLKNILDLYLRTEDVFCCD
jgi:3-dehydroquinate synthase